MASADGDVELSRFPIASSVRVQFSPDGKYLAAGVSGQGDEGRPLSMTIWGLDQKSVFQSLATSQLAWAGQGDQLYFDDGSNAVHWSPQSLSIAIAGRMIQPTVSPGGRYLVFNDAVNWPNRLRILDTVTLRETLAPGFGSQAAFLAESLLFFQSQTICSPKCPSPYGGTVMVGDNVIYNLSDGTVKKTDITGIFDSWPRGNKPWGIA